MLNEPYASYETKYDINIYKMAAIFRLKFENIFAKKKACVISKKKIETFTWHNFMKFDTKIYFTLRVE